MVFTDTLSSSTFIAGINQANRGQTSYLQTVSGPGGTFGVHTDLGLGIYDDYMHPDTRSFAAADIDGDSVLDYVIMREDGTGDYMDLDFSNRPKISVRLSTYGSSCASSIGGIAGEADRGEVPVIGDINHDGLVDVTVILRGCTIYSVNEDGIINAGWPRTNKTYQSVALADLDGDTYTDLLISSEGLLQAIHGDGTEIWHKNFDNYLYYPAIGNVDNDPAPEIVASNGGLTVIRLDGTVKYSEDNIPLNPVPQTSVRLSDIDGDGILDLITQTGSAFAGKSTIYAYKLTSGKTLIPGFPVQLPGYVIRGGMLTANVTKTGSGNDILAPTDKGLVVISHSSPDLLYTILPGYEIDGLILGSTDGANLVAMASVRNSDSSLVDAETFKFTVDGVAITQADQNALSVQAMNHNARRTRSIIPVPLRQGTPHHRYSPDLSHDFHIDVSDLSLLLSGWHTAGVTDLNGDGTTNVHDLSLLLLAWTH
jgi:hypothetical protein